MNRQTLDYAPAPPDNPLKGLVPYAGNHGDRFPHSLEFNYLPLSGLVRGPGEYDWKPMEELLDAVAGRGHQAVFRIFLEYPGRKEGIPDFLIRDGLKVHTYLNTNTQPFPPTEVRTPDYENPALRKTLTAFIATLGKRYDGDPRIGYVTAGLLGTWGEWHDYPRDELFASKAVQTEVMDAYEGSFRKTPVLLRYPAGPDDYRYAPNHRRRLGYHDDSFAWATLDTGKPADSWFFCPKLAAAGARDAWKTRPIGGEIRPEAWGKVFDENPGDPQIQDFARCVDETHATWLMDTGMFREAAAPERKRRAIEQVRRLGYTFFVRSAEITRERNGIRVQLTLENRGIAPLYHDWPAELGLLANGLLARTAPMPGRLIGLPPGQTRTWIGRIDTSGLPPGPCQVLLRIPNPIPGGKPLRFANATQDKDRAGWLTLATV